MGGGLKKNWRKLCAKVPQQHAAGSHPKKDGRNFNIYFPFSLCAGGKEAAAASWN